MKPKAGPSKDVYSEEDWNNEVGPDAQGADAYRYSKVGFIAGIIGFTTPKDLVSSGLAPSQCVVITAGYQIFTAADWSSAAACTAVLHS